MHHGLIEALRDALAPVLRPCYRVAIEQRVYVTNIESLFFLSRPDVSVLGTRPPTRQTAGTHATIAVVEPVPVEVPLPDCLREGYLEVREVATAEVVTVLELLSPANKRSGEGRRLYEEKRSQVLGTRTHLVEVDLLPEGEPMAMWGDGQDRHYRILVSRSDAGGRRRALGRPGGPSACSL